MSDEEKEEMVTECPRCKEQDGAYVTEKEKDEGLVYKTCEDCGFKGKHHIIPDFHT